MGKLESRNLPKVKGKPKASLDALEAKKEPSKKWKKKMEEKERLKRVRGLAKRLQDDINSEQRRAAESRKANKQRKQENERKNMVVQTIRNEKAIRKLSPKHRRAARIFMLHELNDMS